MHHSIVFCSACSLRCRRKESSRSLSHLWWVSCIIRFLNFYVTATLKWHFYDKLSYLIKFEYAPYAAYATTFCPSVCLSHEHINQCLPPRGLPHSTFLVPNVTVKFWWGHPQRGLQITFSGRLKLSLVTGNNIRAIISIHRISPIELFENYASAAIATVILELKS